MKTPPEPLKDQDYCVCGTTNSLLQFRGFEPNACVLGRSEAMDASEVALPEDGEDLMETPDKRAACTR